MEESMNCSLESYKGSEIDSIVIDGTISRLREVRILLKSGKHITLQAHMDIGAYGIIPHIQAERGSWGRLGNANKSVQPAKEDRGLT